MKAPFITPDYFRVIFINMVGVAFDVLKVSFGEGLFVNNPANEADFAGWGNPDEGCVEFFSVRFEFAREI